jgi:hypothetical protein
MKHLNNFIEEYEKDFCVVSVSDIVEQRKAKQLKAKQRKDKQVVETLEQKCADTSSTKKPKKVTLGDHIPSKNKMFWALPQRLANDESIKDIMKTLSKTASEKGLYGCGRVVHIYYLPQPQTHPNNRVSCIVTVSSEQAVNECLKVKHCLKEYMHRLCHDQQQLEYIFIDKCRTKQEIESIKKLKTKLKRMVEGE